MKLAITAFATVLIGAFSAFSASAGPTFQGIATITSVNGTGAGQCDNFDPTGNRYIVRFKPAGLGDNGSDSKMAWFSQDYAQSFQLNNDSFDATARPVVYRDIHSGVGITGFTTRVRFIVQSPATLTNATVNILVSGEIQNAEFMLGCNVFFRMALAKTLEN